MPRINRARALQPGAPRKEKQRRPSARHNPRTVLLAPRRCPECHADLAHLVPVPEPAVVVAELVARRTLDGRETTSGDIVSLLSTPSRPLRPERASEWLRRASRDGLLRRARRPVAGTGGYSYAYSARPPAVAYVADESLARQLALHFASGVASGVASLRRAAANVASRLTSA